MCLCIVFVCILLLLVCFVCFVVIYFDRYFMYYMLSCWVYGVCVCKIKLLNFVVWVIFSFVELVVGGHKKRVGSPPLFRSMAQKNLQFYFFGDSHKLLFAQL